MNYYINGDAAKANKIRAAFEKLGYNTKHLKFTSSQLYYTIEGEVELVCNNALQNLIKTHPDYNELELPVEPKFKVGDRIRWINHDVQEQTITDIKDDSYITVAKYGIKCALKFTKQDEWELVQPKPHYDISNFHAGMPVLVRDENDGQWIYTAYSHYDSSRAYKFMTSACQSFVQCIPFNEETKHLLGTTDMPSEEYINW